MAIVDIPKLDPLTEDYWTVGKPGWFHVEYSGGGRHKPLIRCNCGVVKGIALHHVHADGTVTVFLKLLDYDEGDFPPEKRGT